jgi:hypothetical protein
MTDGTGARLEVVVVGAGSASAIGALRAADLGARTVLVTQDEFGGMAANDGPAPERTLARAARLVREAYQLAHYGAVGEPGVGFSPPMGCSLHRRGPQHRDAGAVDREVAAGHDSCQRNAAECAIGGFFPLSSEPSRMDDACLLPWRTT